MSALAMRFGIFLLAVLVVSRYNGVMSQESTSDRTILLNSILPPTGVFVINIFEARNAYAGWTAEDSAVSYTIRIRKAQNNVLYREISNIRDNQYNITDLDLATDYTLTVAAIYIGARGQRLMTPESNAYEFSTPEVCVGGQVHLPCTAHCVSTCDNPDPVCSRICTSGCGCPDPIPIWHQESCIPRLLCPPPRAIPVKPRNVRVISDPGADLVLVWDPVPDAIMYTVRVKLSSDRSVVLQTLQVQAPIVSVADLIPGEEYVFLIIPHIGQGGSGVSGRSSMLPPTGVQVTNIHQGGFSVSWISIDEAARYAFVLFNEDQSEIVYSNYQFAASSIDLDRLAPGTIYHFQVAAAETENELGIYSQLQGVRTPGTAPADVEEYHGSMIVARVGGVSTTQPPTTTPEPPTICRQRYESVRVFYETFPGDNGPAFPNCDENGMFVSTKCDGDQPSVCWCVRPEDGAKLAGSDYGGSNSQFVLDCDNYGSLAVGDVDLQIDSVKSTSISLSWNALVDVIGYVITLKSDESETRTISAASNSYTISGLAPGLMYTVGVYAVNDQGWSSSITTAVATTMFIDAPDMVTIVESNPDNVTLTWTVSPSAEEYTIQVFNAETEVVRTYENIIYNTFIITGLEPGQYIIAVRATMHQFTDPNSPSLRVSEAVTVNVEVQSQCAPGDVDIIYVIDTSKQSGWVGLQKVKDLMVNISIALPPIKPDLQSGTRIAAVKYYRLTAAIFDYARFDKTSNVVGALRYLPYNGSPLHTAKMLDWVTRNFFTSPRNNNYRKRPHALSLVVIFSGGKSEDSSAVAQAARQLKAVTNVVSVGIEGRSDDGELSSMASRPDLKITVPSFDSLNQAADVIMRKICTLN